MDVSLFTGITGYIISVVLAAVIIKRVAVSKVFQGELLAVAAIVWPVTLLMWLTGKALWETCMYFEGG